MIQGIFSLYSWRYPRSVVSLLAESDWSPAKFLYKYWHTSNFKPVAGRATPQSGRSKLLVVILAAGILAQISIGLWLIAMWRLYDLTGGWQFGLAVILGAPLLWAHLVAVGLGLWKLRHPKKVGRAVVCAILESQVQRLRARHQFKVVAVAGSVGKTSTKIAIAKLLQASRRVKWEEGNYNDRVTVPLIFFGHREPNIINAFSWLKIFLANRRIIKGDYPYDVVVVELGTDGPGFMKEFAYVKPDVAVVSAVSPEHMEYFGTFEAVAHEELTVLTYSKQTLVNIDDTPEEHLEGKSFISYGLSPKATYYASDRKARGLEGQALTLYMAKDFMLKVTIPLVGEPGAKIVTAAAACAHVLGLNKSEIALGLQQMGAFAGRMQILKGIQDTTIIDDTYNATPIAAKAALDVVYAAKAPQRIAILGSMNELGDYSPEAHREVGTYCDPSKLDWVITIGYDAKTYLAPIARERGCQVKEFMDPYKAGKFVRKQLKEGAVVLAKGSQNGVFAEEALKTLLKEKTDETKLVRQSPYWMGVKRRQFPS